MWRSGGAYGWCFLQDVLAGVRQTLQAALPEITLSFAKAAV